MFGQMFCKGMKKENAGNSFGLHNWEISHVAQFLRNNKTLNHADFTIKQQQKVRPSF